MIPPAIEDRQAELEALHREIFGIHTNQCGRAAPVRRPPALDLSHQEIIAKVKQAKNAAKFERLNNGDISGHPSQSEADLAFCSILAFYTRDAMLIDRIYRESGLYRNPGRDRKWDRKTAGSTYGAKTIEKALSGVIETYIPPRQRSTGSSHNGQAPGRGKDQAKKTKHNDIIEELNKSHAVIMLGGKCVILNETEDPTFDRPDITFSTVNDFRNRYSNRKIKIDNKGKSTEIPISTLWLESPQRRQFDGLVFSPGKDISDYYNLWRGFPIEPKKGDCSLYMKHIKEVICNNNEDIFNYVISWTARIVQDPGGERPGTSIALRGKMGTGKGCFVIYFGGLLGPHFLHISNPNQLVGRFNNHLKDCLLCFVDEAIWAGDKTAEGTLKGMITERLIMVEPKGKDAFAVQNHVSLVVGSNGEWVVPAGFEERRFLVLDVADTYIQDHDYFAAIFKEMENGGRAALLYELLSVDLSGINLRKIPRTEALVDQVVHSMPTVAKFWFERLRAGTLLKEHQDWALFVITDKLHSEYINFAADIGDRYRLVNRQFGKELRNLCPGLWRGRREIERRDRWVLFVPELNTCREAFEARLGRKINWEVASPPDEDTPF